MTPEQRQEVFTRVATHLLTQKRKSKTPTKEGDLYPFCAYRGEEGDMCAVGCLIKDEHYDFRMEGRTPYNYIVQEGLFRSLGILGVDLDITFLVDLQNIHDYCEVEEWKEELENLAIRYSLEMPEVSV